MAKIDLATAKAHLRVDHDDEDLLIAAWLDAAYLAAEGEIFRKIYDGPAPESDPTGITADAAINAAVQLIVGHLYANREAVVQSAAVEVPMGAKWLLRPSVNYGGGA